MNEKKRNGKNRKGWLAGGAFLTVVGLVLLAAIAANAAGLAQNQERQRAQRARAARCATAGGTAVGTGAGVDSGQVGQEVREVLAGSASTVNVPGLAVPGEQIPNARTIVATGIQLNVPARGQVIALATALQESELRNLQGGDRDSAGLFQQRPSQGWGTREQIGDPIYASTRFYNALTSVAGWERMPLTVAAQTVQKSGYPDAYAQHEPLATALQQAIAPTLSAAAAVRDLAGGAAVGAGGGCATQSATGSAGGTGTIAPGTLPAGYQIPTDAPAPVRTAIQWALGQLGTPYQWGGTCVNPHGDQPRDRCDCSSLVQRAYGVAGIQLARTTYDQINDGTAVPLSGPLRPGDLVFTEGTAARPEHVAMVIGPGLLVQAPHTGAVVEVVELATHGTILVVRRPVAN